MIKPPWISTGWQRWPTHVLFTGIQEILCDGHHQLWPWLWPETFSRCLQWPGLLPAVAHRPFLTGQYYASVPCRRGAGPDPRGFRPCHPSRSDIKRHCRLSVCPCCVLHKEIVLPWLTVVFSRQHCFLNNVTKNCDRYTVVNFGTKSRASLESGCFVV